MRPLGDAPNLSYLESKEIETVRERARVLCLLDAAERAGLTPIPSVRLHALAYLADVLSPVWNLVPFDGKIYKSDGGPHYPDLQFQLDQMVVIGLVQVANLEYMDRGPEGARVVGRYTLNYGSSHLIPILSALGSFGPDLAIDALDASVHEFLVELANAMATLPNDQIELAAGLDATFKSKTHDVVDFAEWAEDKWEANPTWRAAERFKTFLPEDSSLTAGEKLYLYAAYLGRAINAA